jgi:hypothetical protein
VQAAADRRAGADCHAQLRVDDVPHALALAEAELAVSTGAAETASTEAQDVAEATTRATRAAAEADARTAAEDPAGSSCASSRPDRCSRPCSKPGSSGAAGYRGDGARSVASTGTARPSPDRGAGGRTGQS